MPTHRFIIGDVIEALKTIPDESVHCCVTSPPYWGLRDYGVDGQLGLESTPEEYVSKMVDVFREVKRVLRRDGTLWLNLGTTLLNKPIPSEVMILRDDLTEEEREYVLGELIAYAKQL